MPGRTQEGSYIPLTSLGIMNWVFVFSVLREPQSGTGIIIATPGMRPGTIFLRSAQSKDAKMSWQLFQEVPKQLRA